MFVHISALKIHISEAAHEAVRAFPEFVTECRGEISVKVVRVRKHSLPRQKKRDTQYYVETLEYSYF